MKATVTVDVDIKHARTALMIAGYDVNDKTDEEICEMAIKMNDCYAVETENIVLGTSQPDLSADNRIEDFPETVEYER